MPVPVLARRRPSRRLLAVAAASSLLTLVVAPAAAAGPPRPAFGAFAALGDSYSSGEGLFTYQPGTDTSADGCHRSPLAPGPRLARALHQRLDFAACSGALTTDILTTNHEFGTEPRQLDAVGRRTRTVTMTIGGNDAGFAVLLGQCLRLRALSATPCSDPSNPSSAVFALAAARIAALGGSGTVDPPVVPVAALLGRIQARAPQATIYLAGYPHLFGAEDAGYPGGACALATPTANPLQDVVVRRADAAAINALTDRLNATLAGAVQAAKARGVDAVWVPADRFAGHGQCDQGPSWLHPVLLTVGPDGQPAFRPETLHPNATGWTYGSIAALGAALRTGRSTTAAISAPASSRSSG